MSLFSEDDVGLGRLSLRDEDLENAAPIDEAPDGAFPDHPLSLC